MTIKAFNNKQPSIAQAVYIDDSAVIIGDVSLADNVSVWPTAVIRGSVECIIIGSGTNVQDGSVLHVSHANQYTNNKSSPLIIGKGVTIGHKAVVHGCTIGDYCLIGIGAIIMDATIIEDYVMLGAGSLVPSGKHLQSGYLYIGSPAKQIRALSQAEKEFLEYSAQHYIQLKNRYLAENNN